ncbi:MAG: NUDIX hydrolase [Actinobacteria bacterium]|nr:NUDIX hydrolase [Actinomycetota bacterium]
MSGEPAPPAQLEPYEPIPGWDDDPNLVCAAGGVVWRVDDGELQILLVHRERYDDWGLPKGKLDKAESPEDGARRETEEETGYRCILGHELQCTRYYDAKRRPKTVRYWEMTVAEGEFQPNHETNEIRWLDLDDARQLLSYRHDAGVVDSFARFAGQ